MIAVLLLLGTLPMSALAAGALPMTIEAPQNLTAELKYDVASTGDY